MEDSAIGHLKALSECFDDLDALINQNFHLSQEKKDKFMSHNKVMWTLREELEEVHLEKQVLQDKIDRLSKELMKNTEDTSQTDYQKTIKDLNWKLTQKQKELA